VGDRATMLATVAAALEALSGLMEWPHGFDPAGMSSAVARPGTRAAFSLELGASSPIEGRQRRIVHLAESVGVGLLVDVRQSDHRSSLTAALELEDDVIAALLGGVPGWGVSWAGTTREPVGGDAGSAPYLAIRIAFLLVRSVDFGAQ